MRYYILVLASIIIFIFFMFAIYKSIPESIKDVSSEEDKMTEDDILTEFNLSTFFYFDPVSNEPCNEKNYWTPFDNTTTCFRWISIII